MPSLGMYLLLSESDYGLLAMVLGRGCAENQQRFSRVPDFSDWRPLLLPRAFRWNSEYLVSFILINV